MKTSSLFSSALLLSLAWQTQAQNAVIGRVYPIAEQDLLAVIDKRAMGLSPKTHKNKVIAFDHNSLSLPEATKASKRLITLTHTVEQDITGHQGQTLYQQGQSFNPLNRVSLGKRIVILNQDQLGWMLPYLSHTDLVLVATGQVSAVSATLQKMKRSNRVFKLTESIVKQFQLTQVPTLVEQQGHQLQLMTLVNETNDGERITTQDNDDESLVHAVTDSERSHAE